MVVATEELSRVSVGVGGSLLTRPEILARALLKGGTDEQRTRLLPGIATGALLVAVAVTEPDAGSDVAAVRCAVTRTPHGWRIDGTKTWCTFAGRADIIMLLARTDPDPGSGHRGLSLFVVEKEPAAGHAFDFEQTGGGRMSGQAIPTIGYRGMHSFEVVFEGWMLPDNAIIGGDGGLGRGFYLQMEGFSAGRLQTAARATGLMDAAFRAALQYAKGRRAFGRKLVEFPLASRQLARMGARMVSNRLLTYTVSRSLESDEGALQAAIAKAVSCRDVLGVTSDALQIHGGYGYAEEYPVSRYFVDARVLPVFEGTEEVLALRVIARALVEAAGRTIG